MATCCKADWDMQKLAGDGACGGGRHGRYTVESGWVTEIRTNLNWDQCVQECMKRKACKKISHHTTPSICRLIGANSPARIKEPSGHRGWKCGYKINKAAKNIVQTPSKRLNGGGSCECPDGSKYNVGDKRIDGQMTIACYGGSIKQPRTQGWASACGKGGWEVTCAAQSSALTSDNYYQGTSGGWGGECTCPDGTVYIVGDKPGRQLACYGGTVTKGRTRRYAAENGKKGWEVQCAGYDPSR